jgi:hypothetical protein
MILLATAFSFLHTDDGLVLVFDDDPVFFGLDLSPLAHVPDIATGVGIGILEPVTDRAFTEWSPFFGTIAHLVERLGYALIAVALLKQVKT